MQDRQKLLITIVKLVKKLHGLFFENNFFFHSFSWVTFKWVSFFSFSFFFLCQGVIRVHYICKDILGVRGGRYPPSPPFGSASAWRPSTQELSLALILDLSPIISSHHPPPPHPVITDNAFNQRSTRILIYK